MEIPSCSEIRKLHREHSCYAGTRSSSSYDSIMTRTFSGSRCFADLRIIIRLGFVVYHTTQNSNLYLKSSISLVVSVMSRPTIRILHKVDLPLHQILEADAASGTEHDLLVVGCKKV